MNKIVYAKKESKIIYKKENLILAFLKIFTLSGVAGIFLIFTGSFLLITTIYPLFIYNYELNAQFNVNPTNLSNFINESNNIDAVNNSIDKKYPLSQYIQTANHTTLSKSMVYTISFPSLKLTGIKVTPNVNSQNQKVYESVLKHSAAQFAGTSMPGEGGNTFIYAHSSIMIYHYLYPYSYEGVFSALFDLKINDSVVVNYDNKTYNYIVEGIFTIKSNDFSQIQDIHGTDILTLMTCSPPGIGENRLIIRAVEI